MPAHPTPALVDIDNLENVIKQALPMTMRNESPCEARVALRALLAELRALRAMKLRIRERIAIRVLDGGPSGDTLAEIERLTR